MAIWTKSFLFSFLFLVASFSPPKGFTETFQKLPSAYTISYGDPQAPIHVVEYFSFSCPQCLALLKKEFPHVQEKYINPGKVYWSFHPDPADLLTLQAMICLETLSQGDKQLLLEETARHLKPHSLGKGCFLLQEIMKGLGKPLPDLYDLKWIEKTQAFQKAYTYLSQKQVPSDLPTVEINGILYENFPTLSFLSRQLSHPAHQGEKK
ncbi:MAG: thioredoxin domain-containing protein [Simkania sp.]|nr:thioredoxin domain-containing protein [Simkania sp.]